MCETVNLKRVTFDNEATCPAWMKIHEASGKPAKPVIRCRCGDITNIASHHVHADGRVTASFVHDRPANTPEHPNSSCGWHVFLFLEGYAETVGIDFPPTDRLGYPL